jgi:hypothetical protein
MKLNLVLIKVWKKTITLSMAMKLKMRGVFWKNKTPTRKCWVLCPPITPKQVEQVSTRQYSFDSGWQSLLIETLYENNMRNLRTNNGYSVDGWQTVEICYFDHPSRLPLWHGSWQNNLEHVIYQRVLHPIKARAFWFWMKGITYWGQREANKNT